MARSSNSDAGAHDPTVDDPVSLHRTAHLSVLLLAQRFIAEMDAICQTQGVTQAQYGVLWVACVSPRSRRGVPMGEIADGLVTPTADATRLVGRLVAAGLLERFASPDDGRSVLVRATPAGRKAFRSIRPRLDRYHAEQWSALSSTELVAVEQLLVKAFWGDEVWDAVSRLPTP
jgi:DNA-binding MarR family transcriptional regulator